jgi:molybdopterin molybdotransferase
MSMQTKGMPTVPWRVLAQHLADGIAPMSDAQTITLHGAAGRVLAAPVLARQAIPCTDEAVMDGYALGSEPPGHYRLTDHASQLRADEAMMVKAGSGLPAQTSSVVLSYKVQRLDSALQVRESPLRNNIRRAGEEATQGAALAQAGIMLEPRLMALLAMAGVGHVEAKQRPRVVLLGLQMGTAPMPQYHILRALLGTPALELAQAGSTADLSRALAQLAGKPHLIIVTGPSLGDEDGALAQAVHAAGGTCQVLRAALKPAKPVIYWRIGSATLLGLGGTPYAVAAAAHLFLAPMLAKLVGLVGWLHPFLPAQADFARARLPGRAEALPVCLHTGGDALKLTSAGRFGQLTALAALDGFALVDEAAGDIAPGDPLDFLKWRAPLLP